MTVATKVHFEAGAPGGDKLIVEDNGQIQIGTSAAPVSYTAGSPPFKMDVTAAGSGTTNVEPFHVKNRLTGTSPVGGRSKFECFANVLCGGWVNALKAYMEFEASGKTTGLASALCVEMKLPNVNLGSGGVYFPLEIEHVSGGTDLVTAGSLTGNHTGFIFMEASGDPAGDFDANGFFFHVKGLDSGASNLFYANKQVPFDAYLRVGVNDTVYYLPLLLQTGPAS